MSSGNKSGIFGAPNPTLNPTPNPALNPTLLVGLDKWGALESVAQTSPPCHLDLFDAPHCEYFRPI